MQGRTNRWVRRAAAAAALAAGLGCPSESSGDGGRCEPGATRNAPNACGLCGTGTQLQRCRADRTWDTVGCSDPFDHDGDGFANDECGGLAGGCCVDRPDCDDEDPGVHPDPLACRSGTPERCTTSCGTAGVRTCNDTCTWDDCTVPRDGCNDADDDCDGRTDEDAACRAGDPVGCITICGSTGTGPCTAECFPPAGADCTPPDEVCNGADDDCDRDTDEGFACVAGRAVACTTTCGSTGMGRCSTDCRTPAAADCDPPREDCANGADDDCDGATDELDPGQCRPGDAVDCTTTCGTTGTGSCTDACLPPAGAACSPPLEICNATDDDCDGATDDGFDCIRDAEVACATLCGSTGSGPCSATCEAPTTESCVPPVEACGDGIDDDCDGATDEACGGADTCDAAVALEPGRVVIASTAAAADDYASSTCASAGAPDVAYSLTLAETSDVLLYTAGSSFQTVLYAGRTCGQDDLGCRGGVVPEATGWSVLSLAGRDPGTLYLIVDGASATDAGDFALHTLVSPAGEPADRCGHALTLTPGTGFITADLCSASDDAGGSCGGTGGPDNVYLVLVPATATVDFSTCSLGAGPDTVLHLRSACDDPGTELACNDDDPTGCAGNPGASRLTVTLAPGAYYLYLDTKSPAPAGCESLAIDYEWR